MEVIAIALQGNFYKILNAQVKLILKKFFKVVIRVAHHAHHLVTMHVPLALQVTYWYLLIVAQRLPLFYKESLARKVVIQDILILILFVQVV